MRTIKAKSGPFLERPFYEATEIERICSSELREVGLYPAKPEPVRIDRFIEKRFGTAPTYEELPDGVLGWTKFGTKGVEAIVVARSLGEGAGVVSERQHSSTLAHEAGHGLLHAHLFVLGMDSDTLFASGEGVEPRRILCRDAHTSGGVPRRGYNGRWWEVQANMAMAALLLPRPLVEACLTPYLTEGSLGRALERHRRESAVYSLSETFGVNPAMARIRLGEVFPDADQLTL
jgi:hypothetical protein